MSALSKQVGGSHYKSRKIQPVEFNYCNELPFIEGNIVKYITRYQDKHGVQDLEKCVHYIDLLIQLYTENSGLSMYNRIYVWAIPVEDYCSENLLSPQQTQIISAICNWKCIEDLQLVKELIKVVISEEQDATR